MREESRSRVQIAMSKSALAPVIQQLMDLQETLNEIPEKIERGEEGRAERLRQTIQPTAKALIEGMQILHTEISMFRAAAERQEAASRELRAEVAALRQETTLQREAMTVLQEDLSAFRETSTPGALSDLMVELKADLTESRERVGDLLVASADLLTDLQESGRPGPSSLGEKKWSGPRKPSGESGISPLAVAWRILAIRSQSEPQNLQVLDKYRQQAVEMQPIGAGEDLILATAWHLIEEASRNWDPEWVRQMERVARHARQVLGLP
ncbi:hypothetical protein [Dankookia rubra]|uniref:hypothetical protein n=1 Tax=Dankookia rubra TaxID=1442381 RepID=UPI001F5009DF|nr:hypothetical protein [Dankookia rubra]